MIESLFQLRWVAIWQRNFLVWLKLFGPSLLANFAEPLLVLIIFGYGLGHFIGTMGQLPYMVFLASGIVCNSAMQTATFEGLYSAYTRMVTQHTWEGMLATPLNVQDIILGEVFWAATKSLINVTAISIVALSLGLTHGWQVLWLLPLVFLIGFCFAAIAMIFTALAWGYDFFLYYITLLVTPLALLSGVYFPLESLPSNIQTMVSLFPLAHAVQLARPLMTGQTLTNIILHIGVILIYSVLALVIATNLLKRRLHS
jgi:lipooligosaccharide transport system permease protein